MTSIKNLFVTKFTVILVAAAMMFAAYAPAQAQTAEELQAQITELMATINMLQAQLGMTGDQPATAPGVCPYTWTRNLSQGDSGQDVMRLQQFLNSDPETRVAPAGAVGSAGMETQFFGPATAAAVSKFQVKYRADILTPVGLVNPTGFFGPSSRAKANELCVAAPVVPDPVDPDPVDPDPTDPDPADPAPAPLQGGEGDITVQTLLDGPITIDLGASDTVLEFEVEAVDSDVSVNRVDFTFNERPWLYFDEVNLLVNGDEVASLSGSGAFTDLGSNTYRARFTGLDLVIREDDMVDVALELVVRGSMAGTRDLDTVVVSTTNEGMRFVDGLGLSETSGPGVAGTPTNASVTFIDAFTDGEIRATVADNSPESATILLNETSRTNGVTVLNVDLEARDSDMEVNEFWVELTTDTGTTSIGSVINRARLYTGNTLLDTQAVPTTATSGTVVKFDRVDYMISQDDVREFRVEVDFNRADGFDTVLPTDFTVGTVTIASENMNFEPDTETLIVDEIHRLIVEGLVAEITSITEVTQGTDANVGRYTFTFDVTAYGDTFYVLQDGDTAFNATSSAGSISSITLSSSNAASVAGGTAFRVSAGQTRTFTATVFVTGVTNEAVRTTLIDLDYGYSTSATGETLELGAPDFRSEPLFISL